MKILLVVFITLINSVFAISPDEITESSAARLICNFHFETLNTSRLQTGSIVSYGRNYSQEKYLFYANRTDISGYSFNEINNRIPVTQWHNDDRVTLNANLVDDKLVYNIKVFNYTGSNALEVVFEETRELYLRELKYTNEAKFSFNDGDLIESYVNQDRWVNEKPVILRNCQLDLF